MNVLTKLYEDSMVMSPDDVYVTDRTRRYPVQTIVSFKHPIMCIVIL